MSAAPIGSLVRIYYDGLVSVGDVLRTRTGRLYFVAECRVQRRGLHRGRHHLGAVVVDQSPPDARVRPLFWYSRSRGRQETTP